MGGVHVDFNRIFAVHYAFSVSNIGETIFVNGDLFNPSVYASVVLGGNHALGLWSIANGEFLHVFGDGTIGTCSSTEAGGMIVGSGTTINGVRYVVHLQKGSLDEAIASGSDTDINGASARYFTRKWIAA